MQDSICHVACASEGVGEGFEYGKAAISKADVDRVASARVTRARIGDVGGL